MMSTYLSAKLSMPSPPWGLFLHLHQFSESAVPVRMDHGRAFWSLRALILAFLDIARAQVVTVKVTCGLVLLYRWKQKLEAWFCHCTWVNQGLGHQYQEKITITTQLTKIWSQLADHQLHWFRVLLSQTLVMFIDAGVRFTWGGK